VAVDNGTKVSIIIPCLNEEKVIGSVIDDCLIGIKAANVSGQVLVVDSSTDRSPEIAESMGATVLRVPRRGLGQAYLDSLEHINGKYVIMGDADGTYDFKEIAPFIEKMDAGYEFVMGSRLNGTIEAGAIPKLHRYFGTPLTTWILNRLFHLNFSDIHCGMRALTADALQRIDLKSRSWEYASEMVVKAGLLNLNSAEVPIHFYKDREGRLSHHRRSGWFSPWYAGWINLKIMLLYAPNFVFYIPALLAILGGLTLMVISVAGIVSQFQVHAAFLGFVATTIGYSLLQSGLISKLFSDLNKYYDDRFTLVLKRSFSYSRGMIIGSITVLVGLSLSLIMLVDWAVADFQLDALSPYGIAGLTLMTLGFQTMFFTFVYEVFKLSEASGEAST
jgi:glycosyltransferase involved in cell wall biosynthesis